MIAVHDIASDDERALYPAWLLGVQQGEIADSATEPAPPDGIGTPSPPLESLIDIMGVDRDLVVAAVEGRPQMPATPPAKEIDRWIAALDEHEKAALLARVVRGEKGLGAQLRRRFRRHVSPARNNADHAHRRRVACEGGGTGETVARSHFRVRSERA